MGVSAHEPPGTEAHRLHPRVPRTIDVISRSADAGGEAAAVRGGNITPGNSRGLPNSVPQL